MRENTHVDPSRDSWNPPLTPLIGARVVVSSPVATSTPNSVVFVPWPVDQNTTLPSGDQIGAPKSRSKFCSSTRGAPPAAGNRCSLSYHCVLPGCGFDATASVRPSGDQRGLVSGPAFSKNFRVLPSTSVTHTSADAASSTFVFGRDT